MSSAAWPALVLVEGMPGSGKSTTAQWLAGELERQGCPARWVHEGEVPHPVVGPPPVSLRDWKEILGRHLSGWSRFAAAVRAGETTVVVDSAFLQTSVAVTLRRNLDGEIIRTFVARIATTPKRPSRERAVAGGANRGGGREGRRCASRARGAWFRG